MELISAMPPAAAVPARKAAGIDQNTGKAARMPMEASVSAHRASTALCRNRPVRIRPAAAISADRAQCMRRSPVLSECMPFQTMARVPARKGMAEIRPICSVFWMPISLMMDGDQKAMVALPLTMQKYTAAYSHTRSEEHTSELQSQSNLVCRLLLEKKKKKQKKRNRVQKNHKHNRETMIFGT